MSGGAQNGSPAYLVIGIRQGLLDRTGSSRVIVTRLRYAEAVVRFNQAEVNLLTALGILSPQMLSSSFHT